MDFDFNNINMTGLASMFSSYFTPYGQNFNYPNMHAKNGNMYHTFISNNQQLHAMSIDINSGLTNWDQYSTINSGLIGTKRIKHTPSGIYSTGVFTHNFNSGSFNISSNISNSATSFYGIKYDNSGNPVAMVFNGQETDNNTSGDTYQTKNSTNSTIIEELENPTKTSVYPNPGKSEFTIKSDGLFSATILDINGRFIMEIQGNDQAKFNLTEYSTGVYIIQVKTKDSIELIKLIKE
jgi:hypothetical protein